MNQSEVNISIIVCCYNPDYLKLQKTILSIIKQKKCSFEIVIADDYSKNNYIEKLKLWTLQFNNISFKYSLLEKNQGTVTNIFNAINVSSGSFVKVISPGDYLFDEYTLYRFLVFQRKTEADLIVGNFVYYKDNKILRNRLPYSLQTYSSKHMKRNILVFNDHLHGAALLIKREIIKHCLSIVNGTVKYAEDISIVNICILENYRIKYYSLPMIWYEYGTGISTAKKSSSPMETDSKALWDLLIKKYSSPVFDDIYHDRKVALNDGVSKLHKILTIKGYLFYTLDSYMTFIYKCCVYFGRLINMKRLSHQLYSISSI